MTSRLASGSKLQPALNCLGSAVLPNYRITTPEAEHGRHRHRLMQVVGDGLDQGLSLEAAHGAALAELRESPIYEELLRIEVSTIPRGMRSEVALAYDTVTGRARLLGIGMEESPRSLCSPTEIPIVVDRCTDPETRGAEVAAVIDYKTGPAWIRSAAELWQLRAGGVSVTSLVEASQALVAAWKLDDDGHWIPLRAELDALDLAAIEEDLRAWAERWTRTQVDHEQDGRMPSLHRGPWCIYCPSRPACPAHNQALVAVASEAWGLKSLLDGDALATLSPEAVTALWDITGKLAALVDELRPRLRELITQGHASGLRSALEPQKRFDARLALPVLQETLGEDRAWEALGTSKKAIQEACKGQPRGRGWAFVERALDTVGAVETRFVPRVRECDSQEQGDDDGQDPAG